MFLRKVTSALLRHIFRNKTSVCRPATANKDCLGSTKLCINVSTAVFPESEETHSKYSIMQAYYCGPCRRENNKRDLFHKTCRFLAQDIHLFESFSGEDRTNGQPCNAFLSEHVVRGGMFHNQKKRGPLSASNLHICCSLSAGNVRLQESLLLRCINISR